ncbi:hypothetical protein [Dyadobacter sp. Leaf189]|uniref:hypothetical protein n=1 Tax=Dyadobacter sp. Leaf189 TaxID=1736295 RepID=UPI0006F3C19E|nr:hypothetical protein [Dyadobacter sp. Leaf189]KQS34155.1 hypothetical protein ASG33_09085 [Dyadobacter sp. Leaf189]
MNKKLIPLLLVFVALFQGCRGPEGPQGPAGNELIGKTIDLVGVNFTADNKYQYSMTWDDADLEVFDSDAVLIYSNWETVNSNNQDVDAYRLLPLTVYLPNGILSYNFDRTVNDFRIFLDGTANRGTLEPVYTRNQEFRIIVIPSGFAARTSGALDYNDYNAVVKAFNIDESKIRKVSVK